MGNHKANFVLPEHAYSGKGKKSEIFYQNMKEILSYPLLLADS